MADHEDGTTSEDTGKVFQKRGRGRPPKAPKEETPFAPKEETPFAPKEETPFAPKGETPFAVREAQTEVANGEGNLSPDLVAPETASSQSGVQTASGSAPYPSAGEVERLPSGPISTEGMLDILGQDPQVMPQPARAPEESLLPIAEISEHSLHDCAGALLNALPGARQRSQMLAGIQDGQYTPAQWVLAILLMYAESSAYADVRPEQFLEEAMDILGGNDTPGGSAAQPSLSECGYCHETFAPRRRGQHFCCNACGSRAEGGMPQVDHSEGCTHGQRLAA